MIKEKMREGPRGVRGPSRQDAVTPITATSPTEPEGSGYRTFQDSCQVLLDKRGERPRWDSNPQVPICDIRMHSFAGGAYANVQDRGGVGKVGSAS